MVYDKPAVRIGERYCSPGCGRGCTWLEHQNAHRKAVALAADLGDGWTPEVWENLGWRYAAHKGKARVHPSDHPDRATLYFNSTPQIVLTIDRAMAELELARAVANLCRNLMNDASEVVGT